MSATFLAGSALNELYNRNLDDISEGDVNKSFTITQKNKLDGIASEATKNDTDANLKDRANHTGAQAISTVTGLQTALDGKAASTHSHAISDVTGLQTALDGKASTSHTHGNATTSVAGFMSAADKTKLDGLPVAPSQSTVTRSFNSGFKPSTTRNANVRYSVNIASQVSLSGGQSGEVYLEISENGSTGWITIAKVSNQNTGTLVIGLILQQNLTFCLSGYVPANWTARLRTNNVTGSPSYTYECGQEVLL